jgi:hypothetical protein
MQILAIPMSTGEFGISTVLPAISLFPLGSPLFALLLFFRKSAFDVRFLRGGLYFSCY